MAARTHVPDEKLVDLIEGQLADGESEAARTHISVCWSCARRKSQIEEAKSACVDWMLRPGSIADPPRGWREYRRMLDEAEVPKAAPVFSDYMLRSKATLTPGPAVLAAGAVALLFVGVVFMAVPPMTAQQVIAKSAESERRREATGRPTIVRREIEVRKRNRRATWSGVSAAALNLAVAKWSPGDQRLGQEAEKVLKANGFKPSRPLSAREYARWSKALPAKQERLEVRPETISIVTRRPGTAAKGEVAEAEIRLRRRDLHPVSQTLRMSGELPEEAYHFREITYETEQFLESHWSLFKESAEVEKRPLTTLPPAVPPAHMPAPEADSDEARIPESVAAALIRLNDLGWDRSRSFQIERGEDELSLLLFVESEGEASAAQHALGAIPFVKLKVENLAERSRGPLPDVERMQVGLGVESPASERLLEFFGNRSSLNHFVTTWFQTSHSVAVDAAAVLRLEQTLDSEARGLLPPEQAARIAELRFAYEQGLCEAILSADAQFRQIAQFLAPAESWSPPERCDIGPGGLQLEAEEFHQLATEWRFQSMALFTSGPDAKPGLVENVIKLHRRLLLPVYQNGRQ